MEFLSQAIRLTVLSGVVLIPGAAWVLGSRVALGLAGGILWSLANLWALKALIGSALRAGRPPRWRRASLFLVKFPLLYAIGGWLLLSSWSSPIAFVIGLSLWLLMLVVSASLRVASS